MHIGILAPFHQLGGSEGQILLLMQGLLKRGIRVTFFHFCIQQRALRDKLEALSGLKACKTPIPGIRRPFLFLRKTAALAGAVKKDGIQVLHCWNYSGHIVGGLAARLAGTPALYSVGGLDPWKRVWHMPFFRIANHLATGFVFQSETERDIVCRREQIHNKMISVVPNGVDVQRFRPIGRKLSRAHLLEELRSNYVQATSSGSDDTQANSLPIILSVGSLRHIKGHDVLIEAVRVLRSTQPGLRFHVVIAGDGPLRQEYEQRAADLPVSIVGFQDNTEQLYNAADIYCQPSRSEGMPNSIIEAMCCGLPVVASRVGGVVELVRTENGRLFPPGDSQGLARHLAEMLANRQSWPAMCHASLALSRRFSADNMVEGYLGLYQRMIAQRKNRASAS